MTKTEGSSAGSFHKPEGRQGSREFFSVMKRAHGPWGSHWRCVCDSTTTLPPSHHSGDLMSTAVGARAGGLCVACAEPQLLHRLTAARRRQRGKRANKFRSVGLGGPLHSSHFDFSNKGVTTNIVNCWAEKYLELSQAFPAQCLLWKSQINLTALGRCGWFS